MSFPLSDKHTLHHDDVMLYWTDLESESRVDHPLTEEPCVALKFVNKLFSCITAKEVKNLTEVVKANYVKLGNISYSLTTPTTSHTHRPHPLLLCIYIYLVGRGDYRRGETVGEEVRPGTLT